MIPVLSCTSHKEFEQVNSTDMFYFEKQIELLIFAIFIFIFCSNQTPTLTETSLDLDANIKIKRWSLLLYFTFRYLNGKDLLI